MTPAPYTAIAWSPLYFAIVAAALLALVASQSSEQELPIAAGVATAPATSPLAGIGLRSASGSVRHAWPSTPEATTACPWVPGLGVVCYGVWSEKWQGPIPPELVSYLNYTAPPLLHAVLAKQCPFGRKMPGDVTWPRPPRKDLENYVEQLHTIKVIAFLYSYLPFLVAVLVIIDFSIHRGTRQLWVIIWLGLVVLVNEGIVKKLWQQPRPGNLLQLKSYNGKFVGSCVLSCGMPSSHAALATGWFSLLFLDATFRVHPAGILEQTVTHTLECTRSFRLRPTNFQASVRQARTFCGLMALTPWVPHDHLTQQEYVAFVAFWFFMMVPVPFMRVALYDHSLSQVCVGTMVGAVTAFLWWRFVRVLQARYEGHLGSRFFHGLLTHNHGMPTFTLGPFINGESGSYTASPHATCTNSQRDVGTAEPCAELGNTNSVRTADRGETGSRDSPDDFLEVVDCPDGNQMCSKRLPSLGSDSVDVISIGSTQPSPPSEPACSPTSQ